MPHGDFPMPKTAIKDNTQNTENIISALGAETKHASTVLAQTTTEKINAVLDTLADALPRHSGDILEANKKDLNSAEERGLTAAMIDRLTLNEERIESMASGIKTVRTLDDPTGKILWETTRPNNLKIQRIACPIGVLGMIYESRPNVTIDASILCLKSHNAVILRGGSESIHSALALHNIIQETLEHHGLPKACISMIPTRDREAVGAMLQASDYIDVMIPRGGPGLIERVMNEARMPVFSHLDGICHIYVHDNVNPEMAKNVTLNAKMRRTGICNAMETLLLDKKLDKTVATNILTNILDSGCMIVGDETVQKLDNRIDAATESDWGTEYLDAKLNCRTVDNVKEAVSWINTYGSGHTDSILTEDQDTADYFQENVDSGIVMHNASTQFTDGGEFGMGAEIGIATGKMHARGPVGLEQLCTYKYLVHGDGQTRP